MRKLLCLAVFLLFVNVAGASILPIDSPKDAYNLGDSLRLSYSVSREQGVDALFRAALDCGSYDLSYFTTPVSLSPKEKMAVQVPEIRFSEQMLGSCSVRAFFESLHGDVVEEALSHNFSVTNQLELQVTPNKREFLPNEELVVEGSVGASYGSYHGQVIVSFDGTRDFITADSSQFAHAVALARNIRSGNHSVAVVVNDSFGNYAEVSFPVAVAQVPTAFAFDINDVSFLPNATLRMATSLKDQAGDKMDANVGLKVIDFDSKVIFSRAASVEEVVLYTFDRFARPGRYYVEASSSSFTDKKSFVMKEYELLEVTYFEKFVRVHNVGNVLYDKPVTLKLVREGREYSFSRRVTLKPDESIDINLFTEVPAGTYNVVVTPVDQPSTLFEGVTTVDERPFSKKITGGLSMSPSLRTQSILAPIVIVAFIALVIFYFKSRARKRKGDIKAQQERFDDMAKRTRALDAQKRTTEAQLQQQHAARQQRQQIPPWRDSKKSDDIRNRPDVQRFVRQQLKGR